MTLPAWWTLVSSWGTTKNPCAREQDSSGEEQFPLSSRASDSSVTVKGGVNALLGSIPETNAGCPTSRSFFARCGIPRASPSSLLRSPRTHTGALGSPQRTWAENDGRSPPQPFVSDPTVYSLVPDELSAFEGLRRSAEQWRDLRFAASLLECFSTKRQVSS
jgi:hypothetical protein